MTSNLKKKRPLPSEIMFFKIILNTSLQDGKLMIPNKFTREYGSNLSNPVFLKSPDGIEWEVYWTKYDDGIWFQKGWKEFATYYSLSHGHLVVFNYKETCNLEINILDQSSVEINYPFHGTQNENDNPDHVSNDPVEVVNKVTQSDQKNELKCTISELKPTISCPQPRKKLSTRSSGVVGQSSNLPQHVYIKEDTDGATENLVMQQLISKALKRASTFRSEAPSFMVVLNPSCVCGSALTIPAKYAKIYLNEKRRDDIMLRVLDGRTWPVSFWHGKLCTGWKEFVSDNYLNVGDVCLFELMKSQGHCLEVRIFRLKEETNSPVHGDGDPGRIPDLKCTTVIPIKAMQEASKFTSENPFFTVNIRVNCKGDCRPSVPRAFVRKYLCNKQIVMLQFGKKSWRVNLIIRNRMSRGWFLFAKESKLRTGDVCVFELINKAGAVLDVHIFRGQS